MIYKINDIEVSKEVFDEQLQNKIDEYVQLSPHFTKKEDIRDVLAVNKVFHFIGNPKHILGDHPVDCFVAMEDEIPDIIRIIEENKAEPLDDDAFRIAVALYNAGYRK